MRRHRNKSKQEMTYDARLSAQLCRSFKYVLPRVNATVLRGDSPKQEIRAFHSNLRFSKALRGLSRRCKISLGISHDLRSKVR